MFDCKMPGKYHDLYDFGNRSKENIFVTNNYNIQEYQKGSIIIKLLGCEGLRFVQILNDEEKKCKTSSGLFEVLSDKCNPQYNEIIITILQSVKIAK